MNRSKLLLLIATLVPIIGITHAGKAKPELPTLSISSNAVLETHEGQTTADILITLDQPTSRAVIVHLSTKHGNTDDNDFQGFNNRAIVLTPGQTEHRVTIAINGDTLIEEDEDFSVYVTKINNAVLRSNEDVKFSILNDDFDATPPPPPIATKKDKIKNLRQLAWTKHVEAGTTNSGGLFYASLDLDNDGDLDVISANGDFQLGHKGPVQIFRNTDDGFVVEETGINAMGMFGNLVADFNGDGLQDIFIEFPMGTDQLLLQDVNGGLLDASNQLPGLATYSYGYSNSCIGDLDNDGDVDILNLNLYAPIAFINSGDGHFTTKSVIPAQLIGDMNALVSACNIADFNNDGLNDIYLGMGNFYTQKFGINNAILIANANGGYAVTKLPANNVTEAGEVTPGIMVSDIKSSDFNGDGCLDVAMSTHYFNYNENRYWWIDVYYGNCAGGFTLAYTDYTATQLTWEINLEDVNGNGVQDIVHKTHAASMIYAHKMNNDLGIRGRVTCPEPNGTFHSMDTTEIAMDKINYHSSLQFQSFDDEFTPTELLQ